MFAYNCRSFFWEMLLPLLYPYAKRSCPSLSHPTLSCLFWLALLRDDWNRFGPSWVNTSSANQSPPLWSCSWDLSLSLPLVAKLEVWHESSWCFYIRSGNIKLTFIFPDLMYIICKYIDIYIYIMYLICKYIYIYFCSQKLRDRNHEERRRDSKNGRVWDLVSCCSQVPSPLFSLHPLAN